MSYETTASVANRKSQWWRSKYVTVPLRIGLSVALLVVVVVSMDDIDWDELPDWNSETAIWSIGALCSRWLVLFLEQFAGKGFNSFGRSPTTWRLFSHYMSGQFVSNFLPTTVGGDVVRVSRLTKDTDDGPISFTSVVFERLSGGWFYR